MRQKWQDTVCCLEQAKAFAVTYEFVRHEKEKICQDACEDTPKQS
jgi:hypothetical protein